MKRHPVLGAGSIVIGLAIGYEFVAVMAARRESPFDWTLVIPVYIIASFVGGGALLILGRRLGYLLTLIAWSSLGVFLVLFLVWPQSDDAAMGAALLALIGLAVIVGLFTKSSISPTSSQNNSDWSKLEPRPENLRFARLLGQGVVAAYGLVPLWFAMDFASASRWGFTALMLLVGVAFELAAFWLIPVMTGFRGPFRKQ